MSAKTLAAQAMKKMPFGCVHTRDPAGSSDMPNSAPPTPPTCRVLLKEELDAFEILHRDALDRFARKIVGAQDARDCVGEALTKLRESIQAGRPPKINNDKHRNNLIYRAVKMECFAHLPKRKRRAALEDEVQSALAPVAIDVEGQVGAGEVQGERGGALEEKVRSALAPIAIDVEGQVIARDMLRRAERLPLLLQPVFILLVAGKGEQEIADELGLRKRQAKHLIKRVRDSLKAALAVLLGWLKRKHWMTMAAAAIVIFLLIPKSEPSCHRTDGDGYVVEYSGQCAIGFTGIEHPDLKSETSPIPGVMMVVDGAVQIGIIQSNVTGRVEPFVRIEEGSYAVMINRNIDAIRYCQGARCSDVATGKHVRSGTRPQQWKGTSVSLEDLMLASAKRALILPPGWMREAQRAYSLAYCSKITPLTVLKNFSVSLTNDLVSDRQSAYPFRWIECRNVRPFDK